MQKILVAFNYAFYKDPAKAKRQEIALEVLRMHSERGIQVASFNYKTEKPDLPCTLVIKNILQRNSQETIGNNRPLPYIKEILDGCLEIDCDIFGYMNSDILLHPDFFSIFDAKKDAYIFYRREIADVSAEAFMNCNFKSIWGGDKHPGNDAFFFRKDWWEENRDEYPDDLILGETEWDTVYRVITKNLTKKCLEFRELCHVFHQAKWSLDSKGAINNIKIWNETKQKYGVTK